MSWIKHFTAPHEKSQFYAFGDITMSSEETKYLIAPNATEKLFRIKPNLF